MISAGEFRKGITFEMNGEPHVILDFQHVKPGKGSPFVRTKYKNILTGATREEAFNPNDKFPRHTSKQRRCSICIMTVSCTTSWTTIPSTRFLCTMIR